jgi:hypothetical protein
MPIPSEVHQDTIPASSIAQARPSETINAQRTPGGEVERSKYADGKLSKPFKHD